MKNWCLGFGVCLVIGILIVGFAPKAQAASYAATGNPDDTLVGTIITAEAANETLNYTDIAGNPKPQETPSSDIQITVLPVYGFSYVATRTPLISGGSSSMGYMGQTRYFYLGITNEGNTSDTYVITTEAVFTSAGAGTWLCEVWRDISPFGSSGPEDILIATLESPSNLSTIETQSVAEDATYFYYIKVIYPTTGANPDDLLTTPIKAKTSSTPVGQYTGANGLTYGGIASVEGNIDWKLAKPVLTLTRTATTDASIIKYEGGSYDKVPGSIITYRMVYSNTGNISAESVILADKIPAYTNLAHFNKTGATDNVNLTTGRDNNQGDWTIWYSTLSDPQKEYGNSTGWTLIGTLESAFPPTNYFPDSTPTATFTCVPGASAEALATWVKWEKQYVYHNEINRSITWGVTIR